MRHQVRDGQILQMIYDYDGVVARRQLKTRFWPTASWRAMEKRLALLHRHNFIYWPLKHQRQSKPIPEPIVWLGWQGALWIAGRSGLEVEPPQGENEYQLRRFEKRLRDVGIHWLREPRWNQLDHDLAVADFRMMVEASASGLPRVSVETWMNEGTFRSRMDVVEFALAGSGGHTQKHRKGVRPDGYFVLVDAHRRGDGSPARARFLLELDMATHDNPSFGKEKAAPGLAYIQSQAYKSRFGDNAGRWLVVTTGERRMSNLMRQTCESVGMSGMRVFLFTFFDAVKKENVLTSPIWHEAGRDQPLALISD